MFTNSRMLAVSEDRTDEGPQRMDQDSRCRMHRPLPAPEPIQTGPRRPRAVALAVVLGIGASIGFGETMARAQDSHGRGAGTIGCEFRGQLDGDFTTIAPSPLLTLADSVSGHATGLGKVTGSFTVLIDFNHPVGNGFVLVSKTGSLVAADGDRIDLAMVGTFDVATFDVHYVFVVTGGTGRFAGATGNGTWDVPPPAVFDPSTGSGSGAESFRGRITLSRRD
jgi:hypothetical protein